MSTLRWESVVAQCNQNSWTLWFLVGYRLLFLIILFFLQDWLNSACTSFHWGYWSVFSTQWVLFQGHSSSTSWTHAASLHNVNYESVNNRFALMVIICSHNEMLTFWKMSSWPKDGREGFNINDTSCSHMVSTCQSSAAHLTAWYQVEQRPCAERKRIKDRRAPCLFVS